MIVLSFGLCVFLCVGSFSFTTKVCTKLSRHPVLRQGAQRQLYEMLKHRLKVCNKDIFTITLYNIYRKKTQFEHTDFKPSRTTDNGQKLTFFFCTCSFLSSEALEGLRLNIFFFTGPSLRTKSCGSETPALIREGFCHCAVTAKVARLKKEVELHSAAAWTECRSWEEVTWPHRNWRGKPCFWSSGLHTALRAITLCGKLNWHTCNSSWKCHHYSVYR